MPDPEPPRPDKDAGWWERRSAARAARRRLRRGRWSAALAGGLLAAPAVTTRLVAGDAADPDPADAPGALLLLALATAGPWLVADLRRRRAERRQDRGWR
jgi:hypothetical protein